MTWLSTVGFGPHKTPEDPVDVAPPGAVTRELRGDGWHVQLDLTRQILFLSTPQEELTWSAAQELMPTLPARELNSSPPFVSASALALLAKQFDDGLLAAADLAGQTLKAPLLEALAPQVPTVAAAARLGGLAVAPSSEAQRVIDGFLADEFRSKPIGFYTWNDALMRIFRQDRLLQQSLSPGEIAAIRQAFASDAGLRAGYMDCLQFIERMTNPRAEGRPDLRRDDGDVLFPPSRSHETDLVNRLFGNTPIPDGFSLADELLKRLRAGSLSVEPTEPSGWYDHLTWAIEPLAVPDRMPEAPRLRMNPGYRGQLGDLFKAILAMTRETHAKQLAVMPIGQALGGEPAPVVTIAPELSLEPTRSYYARRADTYAWIRRILAPRGLGQMRRVTPDGAVTRDLGDELDEMIAIFEGAAAVAGHELGITPADERQTAAFRAWAASDAATADIRMMVPVFYDIGRRQTKVWAILGWSSRALDVAFNTPPTVRVLAGDVRIRYERCERSLVHPVFVETYVSRLLDRNEFRKHCDRYRTVAEILTHL